MRFRALFRKKTEFRAGIAAQVVATCFQSGWFLLSCNVAFPATAPRQLHVDGNAHAPGHCSRSRQSNFTLKLLQHLKCSLAAGKIPPARMW